MYAGGTLRAPPFLGRRKRTFCRSPKMTRSHVLVRHMDRLESAGEYKSPVVSSRCVQ
jgi:hypothetical protein